MNQENTREKVELLPCPFCGGNAVEDGESLIYGINCDGCGAGFSMVAGNVYGGIAEVCAKLREKWNQRVSPSSPSHEEVLVRAMDALKRIAARCPTDSPEYTVASVGDMARSALSEVERALQGKENGNG